MRIMGILLPVALVAAGQYLFWAKHQTWWMLGCTAAAMAAALMIPWDAPAPRKRSAAAEPLAPARGTRGRATSRRRKSAAAAVAPPPLPPLIPWSRTTLAGIAAVVAVVSCVVGAVVGIRVKARPTISFHADFDFGKTVQGRILEHSFSFQNTGTKALVIKELRAAEGVTAAVSGLEKLPASIAAGASSDLKVTLATAGAVGTLAKKLVIVTNDPQERERTMTLGATVTLPQGAASHPAFRSANEMMKGDCLACHVTPGIGKKGPALFAAVCATCHGAKGEGHSATPLNQAGVTFRDEKSLFDTIAQGVGDGRMPGFLKGRADNGPLDDAQIQSLVKFIKAWQKNFQTAPPPGRPGLPGQDGHDHGAVAPHPVIQQAIIH